MRFKMLFVKLIKELPNLKLKVFVNEIG